MAKRDKTPESEPVVCGREKHRLIFWASGGMTGSRHTATKRVQLLWEFWISRSRMVRP